MAKVAVGSIPKKITYVCQEPKEVAVGCQWDISWYESEEGNKTVKQMVNPTFPADSADDKMLATAIGWAKQSRFDYNTKQYVNKTYSTYDFDNTPIKNVKVLSLEHRGQGGRAYKALIDNFYVDLREDVLMDTLLQAGVGIGGVLQGEYVWVKMNSQMKLVRVGSELHRLIVEFDSKKDIKPVGKKDLEVGGIYRDRKKNRAIFVGYINSVVYENLDKGNPHSNDSPSKFQFKPTAIRKAMLFYPLYDYKDTDSQIKDMLLIHNVFSFNVKKSSHNFIEKVGYVDLPTGLIGKLRDAAISEIKQSILEFTGHKPPKTNYAKISSRMLASNIAYYSEYLNLYEYGKQAVEPFDVKKLLLFS